MHLLQPGECIYYSQANAFLWDIKHGIVTPSWLSWTAFADTTDSDMFQQTNCIALAITATV